MNSGKVLYSRGFSFPKPVVFERSVAPLPRRLSPTSLVLWVSRSRYLRAADRFVRGTRGSAVSMHSSSMAAG